MNRSDIKRGSRKDVPFAPVVAEDEDMFEEQDRLLRRAIADRRLVAFTANGHPRIAEPHDYGIKDGVSRLFYFQTGGRSSSKPPIGWRWAKLAGMAELQILDQTFDGPRAAPSGRHIEWDRLIASVSASQRQQRK
jgi:hypothetical protein